MPALRHARLGFCIWCGNTPPRAKNTTEHLIPRWVLRNFHHFHDQQNHYTACKSCNERRGPMPPALYASIRTDAGAVAKACVYWHAIAQCLNSGGGSDLREQVLADFSAMIPNETGLRDPRIGVWPIKLVALCQKAPTQQEWLEIARGYPHTQMARRASMLDPAQAWYIPSGPPGEPHSKNPPLKRLYNLAAEDQSLTKKEWSDLMAQNVPTRTDGAAE